LTSSEKYNIKTGEVPEKSNAKLSTLQTVTSHNIYQTQPGMKQTKVKNRGPGSPTNFAHYNTLAFPFLPFLLREGEPDAQPRAGNSSSIEARCASRFCSSSRLSRRANSKSSTTGRWLLSTRAGREDGDVTALEYLIGTDEVIFAAELEELEYASDTDSS